jgi:hypothetical protein
VRRVGLLYKSNCSIQLHMCTNRRYCLLALCTHCPRISRYLALWPCRWPSNFKPTVDKTVTEKLIRCCHIIRMAVHSDHSFQQDGSSRRRVHFVNGLNTFLQAWCLYRQNVTTIWVRIIQRSWSLKVCIFHLKLLWKASVLRDGSLWWWTTRIQIYRP